MFLNLYANNNLTKVSYLSKLDLPDSALIPRGLLSRSAQSRGELVHFILEYEQYFLYYRIYY